MADFLLPDVGEGLTEAEIVTWRVAVGDTVEINQILLDIETAKSIVELPSPFEGTVTALLAAEGDMVPVGEPIISIGDPAEAPAGDAEPTAPMDIDLSNPAASGRTEGESLVGRNKADRGPQRRPRRGSVSPSTLAGAATQMQLQGAFAPGGAQSQEVVSDDEPAVPAATMPEPEPTAPVSGAALRTLAKPPVRKLAKDLGVDLASVTATGAGGTVTRDDVQGDARARETREPVKGVRKAMASAMTASAFSAPHVTEWITVDVTKTMKFVKRLKEHRDFRDAKVSPLLVLAKASILAMARTPEINSWWDEEAQEVVLKSYVNLGIAAATPRGLVVPHVKDADAMTLRELADALAGLVATAREGRTQPAEMTGGTFTITNVGVFGVDAGTPIINPGESAILAFGAINKRPWVVGDKIKIRDVTTLAVSFDHRHVDGEKGSRFLADVAAILQDPAAALLF